MFGDRTRDFASGRFETGSSQQFEQQNCTGRGHVEGRNPPLHLDAHGVVHQFLYLGAQALPLGAHHDDQVSL